MKRPRLFGFLATAALCWAPGAGAYEINTHEVMSLTAAQQSQLDARIPNIGANMNLSSIASLLPDGGIYFFGLTAFQNARSVSNWIGFGAREEDNYCCPPLRFQYHFYNPIAAPGSRGYLGVTTDSREWGLEATEFFTQNYSYRDAREYYYKALTVANERDRKRNMSDMFRSLGQVAHLVQDLAQPQHTRNDSHATGSRYERYVNGILGTIALGGYGSVAITQPDQLWVTNDFKGMADYSNRGFVSAGSNLRGTVSGNNLIIRPNANFPNPDGTGATVVKKQITDADLLGPPGPNQLLIGEIWFVGTPVADNNNPAGNAFNPRTSAFSLFDNDLATMGFDMTFSVNKYTYDTAQALLVPRAVGYSAGLLDYFFRGQLAISAPDDVVYAIIDPTQGDVFSKVKFKVKNNTPNEGLGGGTLWAVAKFHRNTCYRNDLTGEANGPNAPDIVACRSTSEEVAISAPKPGFGLASGATVALSFDFTQAPIPVNATDLFLQVVYRGPIGSEADAVAVGTLDLYEPTHIAYMNGTDAAQISDVYYLFDKIMQGIATGDPTFAAVDVNGDMKYQVPPDYYIIPFDFGSTNLSFRGPNVGPVAVVPSLPKGRFARIAVLTDRPYLDFYPNGFHFTPPSTYNQVVDRTYYVTGVVKLRDVYVSNADVIVYCVETTSCNGPLTSMPAATAANALTPLPVTITIQYP